MGFLDAAAGSLRRSCDGGLQIDPFPSFRGARAQSLLVAGCQPAETHSRRAVTAKRLFSFKAMTVTGKMIEPFRRSLSISFVLFNSKIVHVRSRNHENETAETAELAESFPFVPSAPSAVIFAGGATQ
jgi:hypothetical protein